MSFKSKQAGFQTLTLVAIVAVVVFSLLSTGVIAATDATLVRVMMTGNGLEARITVDVNRGVDTGARSSGAPFALETAIGFTAVDGSFYEVSDTRPFSGTELVNVTRGIARIRFTLDLQNQPDLTKLIIWVSRIRNTRSGELVGYSSGTCDLLTQVCTTDPRVIQK